MQRPGVQPARHKLNSNIRKAQQENERHRMFAIWLNISVITQVKLFRKHFRSFYMDKYTLQSVGSFGSPFYKSADKLVTICKTTESINKGLPWWFNG